MSYSVFEYTLAKLLTNEIYLSEFKNNPEQTLKKLDLTMDERLSLLEMNTDQLSVAAASFRKKKNCQEKRKFFNK